MRDYYEKIILYPVLFFMAMNLFYIIAAEYFFISRAALNVDYVLVILIGSMIHPVAGCLLAVIAYLSDTLMAVQGIYFFDFHTSLPALGDAPGLALLESPLVLFVGLSSLAVGIAGYKASARRPGRGGVIVSLLLVVGVLGADVANGTGKLVEAAPGLGINIGTSQMANVTLLALRGPREISTPVPVDSAAAGRLDPDLTARTPTPVLLVLVESWGQTRDAAKGDALLQRLLVPALADRYSVNRGTVPFQGATTDAEFRELCGVMANFRSALAVQVEDCLPARFLQAGYDVQAFHGYRATLFDRQTWYSRLGFQTMHFMEARSGPRCGLVFKGQCDRDILTGIGNLLKSHRDQKLFIYYLSLNSHLPGSPALAEGSVLRCEAGDDRQVCLLDQIQENFFAALGAVLTDPEVPPVHVLLVGDHAPPMATITSRMQFSQKVVPFLELLPR